MASGQSVNAFVLADQYLRALGWPSTPVSRRVLAAWFMRESAHAPGKNNIWVVGNNPLNISCTSCNNYRSVGSHKIVVYSTQAAGIEAFRQLIHGSGPGYAGIVKAFTSSPNDANALIHSINKSGWVTGTTNSYIHGNTNGLAATYNLLGSGDVPATYVPSDTASSSQPVNTDAFGGIVSYPTGTVITEQMVNDIEKKLLQAGYFSGIDGAIAEKVFHDRMMTFVGKPWNTSTLTAIAGATHTDAANAAIQPSTPGINVTVGIFQALTGKAAAVAAILVGLGLVVMAAYLISKDIYSQSGSNIVSPTPIFVRD